MSDVGSDVRHFTAALKTGYERSSWSIVQQSITSENIVEIDSTEWRREDVSGAFAASPNAYQARTATVTSPSAGAGGLGVVVTFSSRLPVNDCWTMIHFISDVVEAFLLARLSSLVMLFSRKSCDVCACSVCCF